MIACKSELSPEQMDITNHYRGALSVENHDCRGETMTMNAVNSQVHGIPCLEVSSYSHNQDLPELKMIRNEIEDGRNRLLREQGRYIYFFLLIGGRANEQNNSLFQRAEASIAKCQEKAGIIYGGDEDKRWVQKPVEYHGSICRAMRQPVSKIILPFLSVPIVQMVVGVLSKDK